MMEAHPDEKKAQIQRGKRDSREGYQLYSGQVYQDCTGQVKPVFIWAQRNLRLIFNKDAEKDCT